MNVKEYGQVFTPEYIVEKMLSMRRRNGMCMEPSCGDGAISGKIEDVVAIEYDSSVCPDYAMNMDFFDYGTENKFETIMGNPPYVRFKDICEETKKKLDLRMFDNRSNLYIFFIEKCIRHLTENGELIFIVPRDFLKATSAMKLNKFIYESGTITDLVDYGDTRIFNGFSPNCIIFRFEKGNFNRTTIYEDAVKGNVEERTFTYMNGQLSFIKKDYDIDFKDIFYVKVGGVSGLDNVYCNDENGNIDVVFSKTCSTGKTRRMVYNEINEYILEHENELRGRKIINTNDDNWWKWGRNFYKSEKPRIYVNAKTRNIKPFFTNECMNYDGSVLAIFPHNECADVNEMCEMLNMVDWNELGFVCDGRFIFSQKSLENTRLPHGFIKFKNDDETPLW